MKILIDDALGSRGQKSGIGYYSLILAAHLRKHVSCDVTEYRTVHRLPRYVRKWAYMGTTNIPLLFPGYDVIHHVNAYVPLVKGGIKRLLTVHDLSTLHYPETISLAWRYFDQHALKKSIRRADAIVTVSEAVREELLSTFPELSGKPVTVILPATRSELLTAKPSMGDLERLDVQPYAYFLYVGVLHKRKNLKFLLQNFVAAKKEGLLEKSTELVLVGAPSWGYGELKPYLRRELGVRELGYLNDNQISALYKYCKAFIYPSLYEGFGSPLVEAMIQNAPVVISEIAASLEMNKRHGGQMFSFPLDDSRRLTEILQYLDKEHEKVRGSLAYGDLSRYSGDVAAREFVKVYRALCEDGRHTER